MTELYEPDNEPLCGACGFHHPVGDCDLDPANQTIQDQVSAKERQRQQDNQMLLRLNEILRENRERWEHIPEKEIQAVSRELQAAIDRMSRSFDRAMTAIEMAANAWERKASDL
jgi:hypothetical protein